MSKGCRYGFFTMFVPFEGMRMFLPKLNISVHFPCSLASKNVTRLAITPAAAGVLIGRVMFGFIQVRPTDALCNRRANRQIGDSSTPSLA